MNKETKKLEYGCWEIHPERVTPEIGEEWTDSRYRSEGRDLSTAKTMQAERFRVQTS
jgi:hypothetical protein